MKSTYLPLSSRIVTILHMSFAFWVIVWPLLSPFLLSHYELKSRLLPYQNVMGIKIAEDSAYSGQLARNQVRFSSLPDAARDEIAAKYDELTKESELSAGEKGSLGLKRLLLGTSPWLLAWAFSSVVLSLLLLKRIEGSQGATFGLLLLALSFVYFNGGRPKPAEPKEFSVYPTEKEIVEDYLEEPLSPSIFTQHEQLNKGFEIYLIKKWAEKTPSNDPDTYRLQVEEGQFYFNLAKLDALKDEPVNNQEVKIYRKGFLFYLSFLFWNVFFALFMSRKKAFDLLDRPNSGD